MTNSSIDLHLADVVEVVFGVAVDDRLLLDAVDRLRHVPGDELVAGIGVDQATVPPAEAIRARARRTSLREAEVASTCGPISSLTQGTALTFGLSSICGRMCAWEF